MARRLTVWLAVGSGAACLLTCLSAHAAGIGRSTCIGGHGGESYSVPVQILLLMTGLVFLPAIL